ncbi:hypothetical protein GCM10027275_53630 [Rhabdobacter roseus]|uniref:Uncharacterized protein n=1 Tax=Rhabdobacter roseus TaxID=1655419 RepID=A0A840U0X7_9BACT|nr:hypothetical protein [Rhabdobacter roseus]MBB5287407.1 hypothetical protein [Rhabdobacter roseus]
MSNNDELMANVTNHYLIQVQKAFGEIEGGARAVEIIVKSLKEIYRYFEPAYFNGSFFVLKHLKDQKLFDEGNAKVIYDKNIFLNRTSGSFFIQVSATEQILMSESENFDVLLRDNHTLIYHYENNKEFLYANGSKIDITLYDRGSRFASQYTELYSALQNYGINKIFNSSCSYFVKSWADENRLFFTGGGRGNNIPEKFMQLSLYEFLSTSLDRGVSIDPVREFNIMGDATKPKPVDIKITWREANRVAIIELKFLGKVKPESGTIYQYTDRRANEGIEQLKGYHDNLSSDSPKSILRSYLLVIDGRRNNLKDDDVRINYFDGMFFKDKEISIDTDKLYHLNIPSFEKVVKLFATPKTI